MPVTLGNGIKRAFSKIDHQFTPPIDKYILQYFIPEMKSIFLFPENDEKFVTEFMQDANELGRRMCYLLIQRYNNSRGEPINAMDDSTFVGFSVKLLKSLERVHVVNHPNLSSELKLRLIGRIYVTTVVFIEDLLKTTNQVPSVIEDIYSEELTMDSLTRELPKYIFMLMVVFLLYYFMGSICT